MGSSAPYRWLAAALIVAPLAAVGFGGCALPRSGGLSQNCTAATECDDGTPCTDDACGEDGFCVYTPVNNSGSVVQVPYDCNAISCDNGREVASPDDRDLPVNPCVEAACDNGILSEIPKEEGERCTLGEGTGLCEMGECIVRGCLSDQAVCNDDNGCTTDTCDQQEDRCLNAPIDGKPAEDNVPEDCRIKLCVMGVEQELNDNLDTEDDGNPCTTNECDNGTIVHDPLPLGTVCGNDGRGDLVCSADARCIGCNQPTDCNGADSTCQWRTCENEICGVDFAPSGTFVQNTGQCTELRCNGSGGTMSANKPQGTNCNDGQFCTQTDTCNNGGNCIGMTNPCAGPDGDGDCTESCNENQNNCNGRDPNGSTCTDGLFCTQTDTCSVGNCVGVGNPCAGADGDGDCSESCNENQNNCNGNDPNGSACTDGLFCTQTDTCSAGNCVGAGNPCAGADGDGDCSESCNENQNNCNGNDPNGSACTDGLFCTQTDTCSAGNCVGSGNPCSGHNTGPDCNDSCSEQQNNCSANDTNGTPCDNGMPPSNDTCTGGVCG